MRDKWYADNRDLVKWGVLISLAEAFRIDRIIQLAFYRSSQFGRLTIDGQMTDIPQNVISHFRDLRSIYNLESKVEITVFDSEFRDRESYLRSVIALLADLLEERCIVFLDPDTGLAPRVPSLKHVLDSEARTTWETMKTGDIFALYQHRTNRSSLPWIEPKRRQLAEALVIDITAVKEASGPEIANDVVLFYSIKE